MNAPLQSGFDVGQLLVETIEPLELRVGRHAFGGVVEQTQNPIEVAFLPWGRIARRHQSSPAVLPDRFQETETPLIPYPFGHDQRLAYESRHQVGHIRRLDRWPADD